MTETRKHSMTFEYEYDRYPERVDGDSPPSALITICADSYTPGCRGSKWGPTPHPPEPEMFEDIYFVSAVSSDPEIPLNASEIAWCEAWVNSDEGQAKLQEAALDAAQQ